MIRLFIGVCAVLMCVGGCAPQVAMNSRQRGDSMVANRHYDAAVYHYTRAIGEDPNDVGAYSGRARALSRDIDLDQWPGDRPGADLAGALADCDKAIELNPGDHQLHLNRG